jgi:hypothetical protein
VTSGDAEKAEHNTCDTGRHDRTGDERNEPTASDIVPASGPQCGHDVPQPEQCTVDGDGTQRAEAPTQQSQEHPAEGELLEHHRADGDPPRRLPEQFATAALDLDPIVVEERTGRGHGCRRAEPERRKGGDGRAGPGPAAQEPRIQAEVVPGQPARASDDQQPTGQGEVDRHVRGRRQYRLGDIADRQ